MPQLEDLKKLEKELGYRIVMMDSKAMLGKTRKIISDKEVTLPLLLDTRGYVRNTLEGMYTPTLFVIDRQGRLRARIIGSAKDLEGVVRGVLKKL